MSTAPDVRTVERQGTDVIAESDRKGTPRGLFWPWFAANVSVLGLSYGSFVLGLSYGSFVLGFGTSLLQATVVSVVGVAFSFLLCGIVAIAGKRGSAPTMVLSRAAFGVRGNRLPSFLSWVLTVGWETALASLAVLATSTVFRELGWDDGVVTKLVALLVVAALVVGAGIAGFDVIMRLQTVITVVTAVLTVVYVVLAVPSIDPGALGALPAGSTQNVVGALVLVMTGFGLGWVNAAADYSRYLPRSSSTGGVVWWTTFGGALAPAVLVVVGVLLAGSSKDLDAAIRIDPIGALTTILPVWFLIPFALVAILGLVGGAVLDIYSSGLALLSAGVRIPRPVAAGVDGVFMVAGAVYVVFFAKDFVSPFQAFLVTLGVPVAAWAGVFMADVLLRRRAYADTELDDVRGRYGDVRWSAIGLVVLGTALGWGLVTNTYGVPAWLNWQGYLLGPFGLGGRTGAWAYANLGVLVALVVGFVGTVLGARGSVRRQEAGA
ncbi:cytosine permease [Curtobacterium sp. RHCKG23]|uniref:Cytosine permease n=1 Tax=Curtobacterium citri TaxID=3055139 RepID=A0ABT7T8S4_9MICO|nr:cytosine permease [Curtobacterium citri]MDM7885362.1 cytosine permease [Curtobacterium citri]